MFVRFLCLVEGFFDRRDKDKILHKFGRNDDGQVKDTVSFDGLKGPKQGITGEMAHPDTCLSRLVNNAAETSSAKIPLPRTRGTSCGREGKGG